ncbi:GIY-YIG nuclease family protein [Desulfobotulus mexicanus]|nr:GIY-YIG nuclease family protein [Desulfobotulus mexicanus]
MDKGFMYILKCSDGSYYTGSTNNIELRLAQHQAGEGSNHTRKRLPVELLYIEEYQRIDEAFFREKQVQGWSRKKKEALINGAFESLRHLSVAYRDKRGFENLSHQRCPLPETHGFENLSRRSCPLPEALEGNTTQKPKEIRQ